MEFIKQTIWKPNTRTQYMFNICLWALPVNEDTKINMFSVLKSSQSAERDKLINIISL